MDRMEVSGTSDKGFDSLRVYFKAVLAESTAFYYCIFSPCMVYDVTAQSFLSSNIFIASFFSHDLLYFDFFPCSTRIVAYANVQLSHDIKAVIDKILCSILLSVVA